MELEPVGACVQAVFGDGPVKILWAYRGRCAPDQVMKGAPTLADVPGHLPVTHMSAVNDLLLIHWLQEMGHEVSYLVSYNFV